MARGYAKRILRLATAQGQLPSVIFFKSRGPFCINNIVLTFIGRM